MTSQHHFSFPERMDSLIDFIFVRSLFLGIPTTFEKCQKSYIKILVYTPIACH